VFATSTGPLHAAESALVQALGTALQLSGSVVTLGGLLWAWHVLTGYLTRWTDTVRGWPNRLLDLLPSLGTPTGIAQGAFGWTTTKASGVAPTTGTPEERITQLESKLASLTATLNAAIDEAIATEREASKSLRLRDIAWAAGGIAVSIVGYICQLAG